RGLAASACRVKARLGLRTAAQRFLALDSGLAYSYDGVGEIARDTVMNDPRLNSVHLEFPRRHEFRRARELLLEARGLRTMKEGQYEPAESDAIAMVRNGPDDSFPDSDYWLMDRAGIYPL